MLQNASHFTLFLFQVGAALLDFSLVSEKAAPMWRGAAEKEALTVVCHNDGEPGEDDRGGMACPIWTWVVLS